MALDLGSLYLDIRVAGNSNLDRVQQKLVGLERTARGLGGILAGALAAKGAATAADSYIEATNRIRLASKSLEEFNTVQERVAQIAIGTASDLESTALLYGRMAKVTDRFGVSSERVAAVTEAVSKSVALGGSSAQEAAGALRQFTQLMGNTSASAQELNSIMEQTPGLSRALADGLGVAESQLKSLFESGAVTSMDVFRAIESQITKISTQYEAASFSFGKAFETMKTGAALAFGRVDSLFDISQKLNAQVKDLATWMGGKGVELMSKAWLTLKFEIDAAMRTITTLFNWLGPNATEFSNFMVDAFQNGWSNIRTFIKLGVVDIATGMQSIPTMLAGAIKASWASIKTFGNALWDFISSKGQKDVSLEQLSARMGKAFDKEVELAQAKLDSLKAIQIASIEAILGEEEARKQSIQTQWEELKAAEQRREAQKIELVNIESATSLYGEMSKVLQNVILMKEVMLATDAAKKEAERLERLKEKYDEFAKTVQSTMENSILAVFEGATGSIADMWEDMLKRMVAQNMAAKLTKGLFGEGTMLGGFLKGEGKGGGIGGFIGGLIGIDGAKANGGPVRAGGSYLVGEKGPEIFTPRGSGTIIPNGQSMGNRQTVVNFNVTTNDPNVFTLSKGKVMSQMRSIGG